MDRIPANCAPFVAPPKSREQPQGKCVWPILGVRAKALGGVQVSQSAKPARSKFQRVMGTANRAKAARLNAVAYMVIWTLASTKGSRREPIFFTHTHTHTHTHTQATHLAPCTHILSLFISLAISLTRSHARCGTDL